MKPLFGASYLHRAYQRLCLCTSDCISSFPLCLFGIQDSAHSQMTDVYILLMSLLVHIKYTNISVVGLNDSSAQLELDNV